MTPTACPLAQRKNITGYELTVQPAPLSRTRPRISTHLVEADRTKQIKVVVSFTDTLGGVEALTSDAYPLNTLVYPLNTLPPAITDLLRKRATKA